MHPLLVCAHINIGIFEWYNLSITKLESYSLWLPFSLFSKKPITTEEIRERPFLFGIFKDLHSHACTLEKAKVRVPFLTQAWMCFVMRIQFFLPLFFVCIFYSSQVQRESLQQRCYVGIQANINTRVQLPRNRNTVASFLCIASSYTKILLCSMKKLPQFINYFCTYSKKRHERNK